jgi:catechol 2,3-dioxygenase-like lactoylglutathione lyase family enzyme
MKLTPAVIELVVADMATSLAFYRLLGLDIPAEADSEQHVEVPFGGLLLAWDLETTATSMNPAWEPPTGGHRMALAFQADAPADVDAAYAELTAAGAHGELAPWDAFWGQRYAVLRDPDGNPIDLFAPLG